ncbi:MAG: hypothetical protein M3O50_15965 [Myxococcota bacterium]|nr:hypothetical protein [Myxococcota bacterium]
MRQLHAVVPPLIIALPPLLWVIQAARCASLTPLGRDQGIFQYVGWALARGEVDYADVRDVNGPLAHLVHRLFLAFGGADEHRFRVLDLAVTGATFAFVGACLPGLGAVRPRPPTAAGPTCLGDPRDKRGDAWLERACWGLAGAVVLGAQYLLYGFWDLAQRESFFDWFMLPSVALQLVAQARLVHAEGRGQLVLLGGVGALSVVPWFGKPTYALFTLAQVAALLLDAPARSGTNTRRDTLLAFAGGGAIAMGALLAFLCACGDPLAFARIQLHDVPSMYRFIWHRAATDMLSEPWRASQATFALAGGVVLAALMAMRVLPVRALVVALLPLCALGSVIAQGKGFPYHFHPVSAGIHLQWLLLAAWVAEQTRSARRRFTAAGVLPIIASAVLAVRVATALEGSPHVQSAWLLWAAQTPEQRRTREYFAHFPEPDFFPYEMRQAAEYLRENTAPADRVQTYGMDPYVLFLADRLSATPYIYAYDLNVDAALAGGSALQPTAAQSAVIRSMRDANEVDLLARLEDRPPAAFVFLDNAPLLTSIDAWEDFETHCVRSAAWVRARYRATARFGHIQVWLKLDRSEPHAKGKLTSEMAPAGRPGVPASSRDPSG